MDAWSRGLFRGFRAKLILVKGEHPCLSKLTANIVNMSPGGLLNADPSGFLARIARGAELPKGLNLTISIHRLKFEDLIIAYGLGPRGVDGPN